MPLPNRLIQLFDPCAFDGAGALRILPVDEAGDPITTGTTQLDLDSTYGAGVESIYHKFEPCDLDSPAAVRVVFVDADGKLIAFTTGEGGGGGGGGGQYFQGAMASGGQSITGTED